ncbi:unnamed protein product, partial [Mesorhabditis belari]|uniref:Protein KRI1 homolog n=1 Tax=Mesorhabditis belari TaxID=2138241 RepID=A0AAF3EY04_9BILA
MTGKKLKLFDDEDGPSTSGLKINNQYAERYDNWRRLEEMQKMKDKYGDDVAEQDDESSSESEPEWTADDEKNFLHILGALKTNNSSIYDDKKLYFKEKDAQSEVLKKKTGKKTKDKPLYLRDYERKIVTEKEGKFEEDDEEEEPKIEDEGYYEVQDRLKKEIKQAINKTFDDGQENDLLTRRKKSNTEKEEENDNYYTWLKSQDNKPTNYSEELRPLKEAWSDKNLDDDERFLRDFFINKEYELGDDDGVPTYDQICEVEQDEKEVDQQEEFETKYNLRYEEPDQDFIRQYPRTVAETLRKKDSKRKDQREAHRERKKKEKEEKMQEIQQMKNMKKTEINKKLAKLRKLAGDDIALNIDDLEGDFDPAEYDRRMQEVFDKQYYGKGEANADDDLEKPVFSDLSEDEFDGDESDDPDNVELGTLKNKALDAETEDTNEESQFRGRLDKSRRRKKRNSRFAEVISREKPLWDPKEKTFEEYFDEYYALDYEDILGDQRTKFKYRQVVPNSFGLEYGEILDAEDRQLNSWASLKKATAYRTEAEELFDVKAYQPPKKEEDDVQKPEKEDLVEAKVSIEPKPQESLVELSKKKKKVAALPDQSEAKVKNQRSRKRKAKGGAPQKALDIDDQRLKAYGINPKRFKNKLKYKQDA